MTGWRGDVCYTLKQDVLPRAGGGVSFLDKNRIKLYLK